jgi:predicted phosphohydrolase
LGTLKHKHKIVIGGNHDYFLSYFDQETIQKKYITNATYLLNSTIEIEGIKIFGIPYVKIFINLG